MKIVRKSVLTGKTHTKELPVTEDQLAYWKASGKFIQDVFPELSSDDREFLMTGITKEEWDEAFAEEEP